MEKERRLPRETDKKRLSELMYERGIVLAILKFFCSTRMKSGSFMDYQD